MSRRATKRAPMRGYGVTRWGRAFVAAVEAGADHRHITGARRYFRDRQVHRLDIGAGSVTAAVQGSQLDPFEVQLSTRPVDPPTVAGLLAAQGAADDLLALARGEQPEVLGSLLAPTESADVAGHCDCPDEAPRCIHVLAVAFEVAAAIDARPTTLLTVMGTDLPELLAVLDDRPRPTPDTTGPGSPAPDPLPPADYYGDAASYPVPPAMSRFDPFTDLDPAGLRRALRASGVPAAALAEALDDLADLYDRLRGPE